MTAAQPQALPLDDEPQAAASLWDALFDDRRLKIYYQDPTLRSQVYTLSDQEGGARHHVSRPRPVSGEASAPKPRRRATPTGGSQRSNMARLGEHHGRARLTAERVRAIRSWAAPYLARGEIPSWTDKAKEQSVSEGTLRDIVFRRTWTHL